MCGVPAAVSVQLLMAPQRVVSRCFKAAAKGGGIGPRAVFSKWRCTRNENQPLQAMPQSSDAPRACWEHSDRQWIL